MPAATAAQEGEATISPAPEAAFSDGPSAEELQRPERADYWAARAAYAARRAARRGGPPVPVEPAPEATADDSGGGGGGGEPEAVAASSGDLVPSDDDLAALRQCESGGDYGINTGNGYYGAYQFAATTWWGLGYEGYPHQASPAVQDQAVRDLYARSGWYPWPGCARSFGWI